MKRAVRFAFMLGLFLAVICYLNRGHANDAFVTAPAPDVTIIPAESDHQPPRFLPAVALYSPDGRFIALEVGKMFSYTCKAALDDARGSIEKATAVGRRLIGLCIPVPTYNVADLVPPPEPKKDADNTL